MKNIFKYALILMVFGATMACAQPNSSTPSFSPSFYVGASSGFMAHNYPDGAAFNIGMDGTYGIFAGYYFTPSWAVQAQYTYVQPDEDKGYYIDGVLVNAPDHHRMQMASISGLYTYFMSHKWAVSPRLGAAMVHEDSYNVPFPGASAFNLKATEVLPLVGAQLQYFWTEHFDTSLGVSYITRGSKIKSITEYRLAAAYYF